MSKRTRNRAREAAAAAPISHEASDRKPRTPIGTAVVAEEKTSIWRRHSLAPLAGVLIAMAVYRLVVMAAQPGPPGSDAGNWLAFSHQLFGGHVKAADSMYFPVTLVLLRAIMVFFSPLLSLKLLGVIASVSIGAPFYVLLRRSCSSVLAATLTVCLLMTGYQLEMLSWGGYPQLLATTFMLTSLILLDEGLASGDRKTLVLGGLMTALVAGTHHFTLLILASVLALYLPSVALRHRDELRVVAKRFAVWAAASAGFGLVFAPWYVWYVSIMAGGGSLNANQQFFHGMGDVFSFVFSEAPLTWMLLMIMAPVVCFAPFGKPDNGRIRPLALALIFGPVIVYAATHEVRIFQDLQVGVLLAFGVFAGKVENYLPRLLTNRVVGGVGYMTYGMGLAGLLLLFTMNGNLHFYDATDRYESMDTQAKDAFDWVKANTPQDARFLSSGGGGGWVNYAWWMEGYGERPSYGDIVPSFLAFKQERTQAEAATKMLDPATPATEVKALVDDNKIDYLFIYKPNGGSFQNLTSKVPVYLSYENDEFAVLRVRHDAGVSASAHP